MGKLLARVQKYRDMSPHADRISVLALVPYPLRTVPGQRFRIEQWEPYLKKDNITVAFRPFLDLDAMKLLYQRGHVAAKASQMVVSFARRVLEVATCKRYDVILIYRTASLFGPALLERAALRVGKPIIFDFDDAIYLLDASAANRRLGFLKCPGKTATLCRISSHVVVGNSHLACYAGEHNDHVTVIPSSVDTKRYRPNKKTGSNGRNGRVVVGWMGSSTSQHHLELFHPLLLSLNARREIELCIISDRKPLLPGMSFVWRPWSAATELEELGRFDIGIMPMPDTPWCKGKCGMKALQYMAMGAPAVCSAVGANCEIIQHGENGLLASTDEEWLHSIKRLVDDPALRARLGKAGRQTVEEHYSAPRCASQFAAVIRELVDR